MSDEQREHIRPIPPEWPEPWRARMMLPYREAIAAIDADIRASTALEAHKTTSAARTHYRIVNAIDTSMLLWSTTITPDGDTAVWIDFTDIPPAGHMFHAPAHRLFETWAALGDKPEPWPLPARAQHLPPEPPADEQRATAAEPISSEEILYRYSMSVRSYASRKAGKPISLRAFCAKYGYNYSSVRVAKTRIAKRKKPDRC